MKDLIEEWERSAEKYQSLGRKAVDPIRQEGLLCRSGVYSYCADKLRRRLQAVERVIKDDKNCTCEYPYYGLPGCPKCNPSTLEKVHNCPNCAETSPPVLHCEHCGHNWDKE